MIVVDTNIISELMKHSPSPAVAAWIDQQNITQLFITTVTIAEIAYGLHALPEGNRRQLLECAFNQAVLEAFSHRILPFDEEAAHCYGKIMGQRKKLGRPLGALDGQIASIAYMQRSTIATRNTRDFSDCGLQLVNPFEIGDLSLRSD